MRENHSKYLSKAKPVLKRLVAKLSEQYAYVSVLAVDSISMEYRIAKSGISVNESPRFSKKGYVVRVCKDGRYGEYSFNKLPEDTDKLALHIEELLAWTDLPQGLEAGSYPLMPDEPAKVFCSTPFLDEEQGTDEYILDRLTKIRESAFGITDKLLDMICRFAFRRYHKLFLSKNRELEQNVCWSTAALLALGRRGEELKQYYRGFSALGGNGLLDEVEKAMPEVVNGLLDLFESGRIIPGEYECICTPDVTGMIAHEAFGHGVEEDMFVKDRALSKDFFGKYVASPLITMHDGASAAEECATYFFDDEGVVANDTVVIDKGILVSGINDALSALQLSFPFTGNGRRESFERKAYTRMTNTYFEGGESTPEEMIASVKNGFLLENAFSGMEDPKNWGIQLMVNVAREIKDGKLTGKVFSPIVLTGYVPDLLKSITMLSKTPKLCGSGFCGKGYKEWVKVSDGGPYIKAKIRLG